MMPPQHSFCRYWIACAIVLGAALCDRPSVAQSLVWRQLPPIPDAEGFAGSFAGVSGGVLVVAGGTNFPDQPPSAGGAKRWYDTIFALETPTSNWRVVGKLPGPLGYGVSITTPEGIVCIGGSDAQRHYAKCFVLRWTAGTATVVPLPELPQPCANACGALVERTVYVAGGTCAPDDVRALETFWALDLENLRAGWAKLATWPGPGRLLSVAGSQRGSFFLFSGAALEGGDDGKPVRRWLRDAYRYSPDQGWQRLSDLPRVAVAAPSPAPTIDSDKFLVLGGDDGTQVSTPPREHRGFPRDVLSYDTRLDRWTVLGEVPFSLVTTPAVRWNERIVVPGGEARPAVRSNVVWSAEVSSKPER